MEKWVVSCKRADFKEIGNRFGIDPVIARLIRNRDVEGDEEIERYLHGTLTDMHDPRLMKDMEKALGIVQEKIRGRKKMRIIGDYDIDGVVSTYILIEGLKGLGAWVDAYIPDRITDGYGINQTLIEKAGEDGIDTIITCDNGIAAYEEVKKAKEMGMTVVVTDHHEVPYEETEDGKKEKLPPADAVVNPKQKACLYPFKGLCGAGVAYKLIQALYERYARDKSAYEKFIDLAAVATVGDVMDLEDENRIIVKEGLKRINRSPNTGLKALIAANQLDGRMINTYHIGFVLGPCINASGRLDTAARSLQLFRTGDEAEAARIAGDLKAINESRKAMTQTSLEEAIEQVETTSLIEDKVLVVYLPDCHESLAGIIAGRLREKYNRPTFVLTKGAQGVKGSGRSIEAYSMYDKLVECSEYLSKFGGHPMAAGLSLPEDKIIGFRMALNEKSGLTEKDFISKVVIDVPMPVNYVSKSLIRQLELLEPFGKGNTKPMFAQKGLTVLNPRVFGNNRNVVKMQLQDQTGGQVTGIYFGAGEEFYQYVKENPVIDIVYYPAINEYQGRENLQITILHYQ